MYLTGFADEAAEAGDKSTCPECGEAYEKLAEGWTCPECGFEVELEDEEEREERSE